MHVLHARMKHVLKLGPDVPKGGQNASTFNPTNLAKHLGRYHAKDHEEVEQAKRQKIIA